MGKTLQDLAYCKVEKIKLRFYRMLPLFRKKLCFGKVLQASPICLTCKSNVFLKINMEHWWNGIDRGKLKFWERNII